MVSWIFGSLTQSLDTTGHQGLYTVQASQQRDRLCKAKVPWTIPSPGLSDVTWQDRVLCRVRNSRATQALCWGRSQDRLGTMESYALQGS